jgi:5-methylthioadenosine/S-adenosylhomocysteine deaminase
MQKIDALIFPRWIIPVEPENKVYEDHALAINQGKILEILPHQKAREIYAPAENIILDEHVVLPGFINAHTHSPMNLLRGLGDDLALMTWLEHHIWPAEKKWLSEAFCYDGARLALMEMIRGGTTCFNDNYFFLEGIGRAVSETGLRATLGVCVLDFPTPYANTPDEYLLKAEKIYEEYYSHPLISMSIAPHAPYTVSDQTFIKVKNFAEKYAVKIHIHLQETRSEIMQASLRPVQRLHKLGILSPNTQAIHLTQVNEEDIALLGETGTDVVHCPESNLKLASGFCPVKKLLDAGINVALGTDGAASNNDLDMLGEMKTAAILAKAVAEDPTAVNAFTALKMATLNGARAMGLDKETGSLLPQKSADFIAIDLSSPNTQPVFNPLSQIVYAAHSQQVSDVWVAGKRLLKDRQFVDIDTAEVLQKARKWREKIAGSEIHTNN